MLDNAHKFMLYMIYIYVIKWRKKLCPIIFVTVAVFISRIT